MTDDTPDYKDADVLRELYVEKKLSTIKIADRLDCSPNTVRKYLKENGIEIRSQRESLKYTLGHDPRAVTLNVQPNGYVRWVYTYKGDGPHNVYVHRLLAVAEYGFDAVAEMEVHHKNEIPWDNRPDNIEPKTTADHSVHHSAKLGWLEQLRAAEMYRAGCSSYQVAEVLDVSPQTVLRYIREFDGVEVRSHKEAAKYAK